MDVEKNCCLGNCYEEFHNKKLIFSDIERMTIIVFKSQCDPGKSH